MWCFDIFCVLDWHVTSLHVETSIPCIFSLIISLQWEQAAALKAQIKQRQRRGEVKMDSQGNIADKTTRLLQGHINNLERPLKADEQEQAALLARERSFRSTAMRSYRRQALYFPLLHWAEASWQTPQM